MKIIKKLSPIMESISNVGKDKKKIDEELDVAHPAGVLPHADAVAMEQHIADRAAGLERRANPDKDPLVKELIEETASEKSRTLHYDVVDRKGLAKILTEAKKNKCEYKVGRSDKAGYRYFVDIIPIYGSKGALEVDDGSTEVDGETLTESLDDGEACFKEQDGAPGYLVNDGGKEKFLRNYTEKQVKDLGFKIKKNITEDIEKELKDYIKWCEDNKKEAKDAKSLEQYIGQLKNPGKSLTEASTAEKRSFKQGGEATGDLIQGKAIARVKDPKARQAAVAAVRAGRPDVAKQFYGDRKEDQAFAANDKKMAKMQRYANSNKGIVWPTEEEKKAYRDEIARIRDQIKDPLKEDLQLYASSLKDFKPAKEAEELWNEIIEKGKLDDLEYELENVFKADDDENASIDIEGLNDLLVNHQDFIRTLIGLDDAPLEDDDYNEEPVGENEMVYYDDDEEPVDEDAPIETDEDDIDVDEIEGIDVDDEDDIEPIYADGEERKTPIKWKKIESGDEEEPETEEDTPEKEDKEEEKPVEESLDKKEPEIKLDDEDDDLEECDKGLSEGDTSKDDDLTENIAKGFVKSKFTEAKDMSGMTDEEKRQELAKQSLASLNESDEEIIDIDDRSLTEALGMPTEDQVKKEEPKPEEAKPAAEAPTDKEVGKEPDKEEKKGGKEGE